MSTLAAMTNLSDPDPVVGVVHSTNFPELLRTLGGSLFITTYQANRILVCTTQQPEKITVLMRSLSRPMGLALTDKQMAVCCKNQIWFFSAVFGLNDIESKGYIPEFTFAPRWSQVTGDVAAHQAAFHKGQFFFVNTRFSCVCTLDKDSSFTPIWKPHFISELDARDRCHLNGFCFDDREMRYATALGESDVSEGWKANKVSGGIVIDVLAAKTLARGLSMPHSPKLSRGKLYILESGRGRLVEVNRQTGALTEIASFPGFLRGLDIVDRYAFVGLCKIREDKLFRGLPIEEQHQELICGVHVVDLESGQVVAVMQFTKGIEELFDIGFYRGAITPHVVGFEGDLIDGVMVLPQPLAL